MYFNEFDIIFYLKLLLSVSLYSALSIAGTFTNNSQRDYASLVPYSQRSNAIIDVTSGFRRLELSKNLTRKCARILKENVKEIAR